MLRIQVKDIKPVKDLRAFIVAGRIKSFEQIVSHLGYAATGRLMQCGPKKVERLKKRPHQMLLEDLLNLAKALNLNERMLLDIFAQQYGKRTGRAL